MDGVSLFLFGAGLGIGGIFLWSWASQELKDWKYWRITAVRNLESDHHKLYEKVQLHDQLLISRERDVEAIHNSLHAVLDRVERLDNLVTKRI